MILYIYGKNLLAIHRLLNLSEVFFCLPTDQETMSSIEANQKNIKALYKAKLPFVLELDIDKVPPKYVAMKQYEDGGGEDVNWWVPEYQDLTGDLHYCVEYKSCGTMLYVTVNGDELENMINIGVRIKRVSSRSGARLSNEMLGRFGLQAKRSGEFRYAIPRVDSDDAPE